jgi:hypothetical protein
MSTVKTKRPRFRGGDWVSFPYGGGDRRAFAQIIESDKPLFVNGHHLYRVRLEQSYTEPAEFTRPDDRMEKAVPDKATILQYLKRGGLADLLRTNLREGEAPPRVWLTYTPGGDLTHTLNPGLKVAGKGTPAPFFAVLKNKVYALDKAKVIDYLKTSFGLTQEEAEDVVQAVGTAP